MLDGAKGLQKLEGNKGRLQIEIYRTNQGNNAIVNTLGNRGYCRVAPFQLACLEMFFTLLFSSQDRAVFVVDKKKQCG